MATRMSALRITCINIRTFTQTATKHINSKPSALLDRIIRVDHAGEFGADRIYAGQYAVLSKTEIAPVIKEMHEQEKEHLACFQKMMVEKRARPSVLLPVWNVAGFLLGAGSALCGKQAAMACTVAVETVIGEHYNNQIRELMEDDPEKHRHLLQTLKTFRDEELNHLQNGLDNEAEQALMYEMMSQALMAGCRTAIWLSERI